MKMNHFPCDIYVPLGEDWKFTVRNIDDIKFIEKSMNEIEYLFAIEDHKLMELKPTIIDESEDIELISVRKRTLE